VKRLALGALLIAALLTAHVLYWYVPRERAAAPRLRRATSAATGDRRSRGPVRPDRAAAGRRGGAAAGEAGGPAVAEPLEVLAAGDYDVCLWVPYPHQNLGALAAAIGELGDVVGAAARLTAGGGGEAAARSREPEEAPTFGPFEVPPANEMVACSDLAGGRPRRLRVVARIYPVLAVVAKLAGHLAGNPWLAGGTAGPMRIAWEGRLWSVTSGPEMPPAPPAAADAQPGPRDRMSTASADAGAGPEAAGGGRAPAPPDLPESLAVVHWTGARQEIPAGYYALTRSGSDLAVSLIGAGGGSGGGGSARSDTASSAALAVGGGPVPSLLVAVGSEWHGAGDGSSPAAGAGRQPPLPPAALVLFETGGSRLSTLGDLPGLAVFNGGPAGAARWRLPTEGMFRLLAKRLPTSEVAGWKILALDPGSLRQAEALAPRLAVLVPPAPGDVPDTAAAPAAAGPRAVAAPASPPALSLGLWLEPRSALRIVSRIRQFVEKFPLASRRQVELWRDWETVLDPLANCDHAALTATASPASMRLLLQNCTATVPH
jgi:hypothetical protein